MTTVLLAEDDRAISEPLTRALEREGYEVMTVSNGRTAYQRALSVPIALLILDLGLPYLDGLDVCRRLREAGRTMPVLMLTARTDEMDVVVGLDAGADDYVAKPFRLGEVLARARALLRRTAPDSLDINGVKLDVGARQVTVEGVEVILANKEFELLRLLMINAGQVVSREQILADVWSDPALKTSKTLDMHMSWLRRKLAVSDSAGGERLISTVRGLGFRFNVS